jgi:hypothetical protein
MWAAGLGVRPGVRPLLIHATMSIYPRTAIYFFIAFASGSQRLAKLEKLMGYPSQFRGRRPSLWYRPDGRTGEVARSMIVHSVHFGTSNHVISILGVGNGLVCNGGLNGAVVCSCHCG